MVKNCLLILSLILLISCYSTKPHIEPYIPLGEFQISNPSASFTLIKYTTTDDYFNSDTISVFNGAEIFAPDSIVKEVIDKPTPFSPSTEFIFILFNEDSVTISINSPDSAFVKDVYSGYLNKGYYGLLLNQNENEIESGVYWINYKVGDKHRKRKFMLMR